MLYNRYVKKINYFLYSIHKNSILISPPFKFNYSPFLSQITLYMKEYRNNKNYKEKSTLYQKEYRENNKEQIASYKIGSIAMCERCKRKITYCNRQTHNSLFDLRYRKH